MPYTERRPSGYKELRALLIGSMVGFSMIWRKVEWIFFMDGSFGVLISETRDAIGLRALNWVPALAMIFGLSMEAFFSLYAGPFFASFASKVVEFRFRFRFLG